MTGHTKRQMCRVCGGTQLTRFLSLGPTPLANAFLRSTDEFLAEQFYPLDVYRCEGCSLVQLLDLIDPGTLFSHYIYVTGTSETVAEHNRAYSKTIVELLKLQPGNLVVEVASNDGSLLKCFEPYGMRTLGVEPAENISELARSQGVETLTRFFNSATGREVQETYGAAHVVIANNVLAHVDDTPDFLEGCKHVLKPDGLIVIEVPYLRDLLDRLEYDTIYHEHLCYFSVTTLMRLCDRVGLSIRRVEHVPLHGGSLRVYLGRQEVQGNHADAVLDYSAAETEAGFENMDRYERFAADVALNPDLRELYPFSRLSGPANVLIMPALHSANISSKLLQELGGVTVIGPILVGLTKAVQIAAMGASVGDLVNMAALAAHEAARR